MLIVAPPSESKRPRRRPARRSTSAALSFPALTPLRLEILDALEATSAAPDAFRRLQVRPTMAHEVARNTVVRELPTRPVLEVYAGPLHEGLDASTLSPAARARADEQLVVASSLWGALRPVDRIPPYRLHICSHLSGWTASSRPGGPSCPACSPRRRATAGCRRPPLAGLPGDRHARRASATDGHAAVDQRTAGGRIGDVVAKRVRGQAARLLLEEDADPDDPAELAAILGERWPVALESPVRPGATHRLTLFVAD